MSKTLDYKKEADFIRKTAGEMCLKAASDNTKYQSMEVAYAMTKDIEEQLYICADRHNHILGEDEYCIGYVLATDPLLKNVMRRKFFAMLYLPSPRPSQTIFLYDKRASAITKRLWTLPNPATMAELSECMIVHPSWKQMKGWCDAFFDLRFWPYIRKESQIDLLSESEYLNRHRKEIVASSPNQVNPLFTKTLDPVEAMVNQVVHSDNIVLSKNVLNRGRKA